MIKKIVITIIVLILVNSFAFASENIKIGLEYEKEIDHIRIESINDLFMTRNNNIKYNLKSKDLTLNKDDNYYLKINNEIEELDDAISIMNSLDIINKDVFLNYNGVWEIFIGGYKSNNEAENDLLSLKNKNLLVVSKNSKRIKVINNQGEIVLTYNNRYDIEFSSNENISINGKSYRGSVMIKRYPNSDLTVINTLSLNDYLYGVVPNEMPTSWDIEALKAQAVAARNYAVSNIGRFSDLGFDLTDDIKSQVYGGIETETAESNLAVDQTKDILLKSGDNLVVAYYHSNSGGQTENSENVWSSKVSYLVGVKDEFSENVKNSNWTKCYTITEISDILRNAGKDIGKINDVQIKEVSDNNRVMKLVFTGTTGTVTLEKSDARKIFGYSMIKSMWFSLEKDNEIVFVDNEKYNKSAITSKKIITASGTRSISTNETLNIYNGDSIKKINTKISKIDFVGKGFGHGLGMSQWGAKVMAERGYSYDQILRHYYKGTYLEDRSLNE